MDLRPFGILLVSLFHLLFALASEFVLLELWLLDLSCLRVDCLNAGVDFLIARAHCFAVTSSSLSFILELIHGKSLPVPPFVFPLIESFKLIGSLF